mmetsp:Transcript_98724/g.240148  ORF Transcript_98724/g.240148 Transcript_98724/m.240148 type:complete len:204 (-) Transcript_98724:188-799(-)
MGALPVREAHAGVDPGLRGPDAALAQPLGAGQGRGAGGGAQRGGGHRVAGRHALLPGLHPAGWLVRLPPHIHGAELGRRLESVQHPDRPVWRRGHGGLRRGHLQRPHRGEHLPPLLRELQAAAQVHHGQDHRLLRLLPEGDLPRPQGLPVNTARGCAESIEQGPPARDHPAVQRGGVSALLRLTHAVRVRAHLLPALVGLECL